MIAALDAQYGADEPEYVSRYYETESDTDAPYHSPAAGRATTPS